MTPNATTEKQCPASMCPLIAPNGSPWTGDYAAPCPGKDGVGKNECPWWGMACHGGGMHASVDDAAKNAGQAFVIGPNRPKRELIGSVRSYDCPKAGQCRWQEQSESVGLALCPPRDALKRGLDPRVCLF